MKSVCKSLALIANFLLLASCSHTYHPSHIQTTDFLGDYFQLKESGEDDALLSYWKKGINWAGYKKIILEPVIIMKTTGSELNKMTHADRHQLREVLSLQMQTTFKNDGFKLVRKPGPDTLIVQFAITDADTLTVLLNSFSSIYPSALTHSALKPLFTGKDTFASKTGIEGKIIDSTTGQLLMASADAIAGGKPLVSDSDEWEELGQAYKYWAPNLGYQLCLRQKRVACQKPKPESD